MDTTGKWVVSIPAAVALDTRLIGGKARKLAQLYDAGFRTPQGFCITVAAYERFLSENRLFETIRMELGRKPLAAMRYEEIWDAALRIRSAFLSVPIPPFLVEAIAGQVSALPPRPLAARSSSPREDTAEASFAGLHESVIDINGQTALLNAIRVVWASLWSDAALLYQRELALDPLHSKMAVLIQEMIEAPCSGVAFGRDPGNPSHETAIIEAVPGKCKNLVDGTLDPDRWILDRRNGDVIEWRQGFRKDSPAISAPPLLNDLEVGVLFKVMQDAESRFGWPPDMEWTDTGDSLTVLQIRPISTVQTSPDTSDRRAWYLTLRPRYGRLKKLAARVSQELIPALEQEGRRFEAEAITDYDDQRLAHAIDERKASLEKWKKIYWDEFIPFAHGVRQLGMYYNDAVHPEDPYEFVALLKGESMLATQRNQMLFAIAEKIAENSALHQKLRSVFAENSEGQHPDWQHLVSIIRAMDREDSILTMIDTMLKQHMNVVFESVRLNDHPEMLLKTAVELTGRFNHQPDKGNFGTTRGNHEQLEKKLLSAVGADRQDEAREMIMIGRLSWRLRDDDNILIGRLENQLFRSLQQAVKRLQADGRWQEEAELSENATDVITTALRHPEIQFIRIPEKENSKQKQVAVEARTTPRQLTGQPGSPGVASGKVKKIITLDDFKAFKEGQILVCDAVQPSMTHLVPLAAAVVERRGGMLIHSAIIARELGIPCINGIEHVVDLLSDGEWVTVDGYLGILTIGPPEFELELQGQASVTSLS